MRCSPAVRGLLAGAAILALAGCAISPPPLAELPPDMVQGAGDPTRSAILHTAYVFNHPAALTGQPAEAALALAEAEHLAVELPTGTRWIEFSPLVGPAFATARQEWRGALGIPGAAPPQDVIDALIAAHRALVGGNRAAAASALRPGLFAEGGEAALSRLAALPPLPRTGYAASLAQQELNRQQSRDDQDFPGF